MYGMLKLFLNISDILKMKISTATFYTCKLVNKFPTTCIFYSKLSL